MTNGIFPQAFGHVDLQEIDIGANFSVEVKLIPTYLYSKCDLQSQNSAILYKLCQLL